MFCRLPPLCLMANASTFSQNGETKEVKQYHFTSWPDHGVPKYPTQLLTFRRRFKALHTEGSQPIIVHCRSVEKQFSCFGYELWMFLSTIFVDYNSKLEIEICRFSQYNYIHNFLTLFHDMTSFKAKEHSILLCLVCFIVMNWSLFFHRRHRYCSWKSILFYKEHLSDKVKTSDPKVI